MLTKQLCVLIYKGIVEDTNFETLEAVLTNPESDRNLSIRYDTIPRS